MRAWPARVDEWFGPIHRGTAPPEASLYRRLADRQVTDRHGQSAPRLKEST